MVLEKLGEALQKTFNKIASAIFLDKGAIDAIVKELQRALFEADVDTKLVFEIGDSIRALASNERIKGIERKEQLVKLIHDEIVRILGREKHELKIEKPSRIIFIGLYGSGKTTTIAKLALYYSKRGYKCCMLGLDVHRPAAPEQLEQLGKRINLPSFVNKEEKNPLKIWRQYESHIIGYDICFIDTAGRDALDSGLIEEIKGISGIIKPQHTILVMPADIGQAARKQAAEFKKACDIDGVIITRMDGTAKAGGAISACYETNAPVLFVGIGEHERDIEQFNPTALVSRMLGMGDLETLIDRIKTAAEPRQAEEKREFTLLEFYKQIKSMQEMGPLSGIANLLPGIGKMKLPSGMMDMQQEKIKEWRHAIDSMTKQEIENPELIKETRVARIAKGAGVSSSSVRDLLNNYKLIKQFASSGIVQKAGGASGDFGKGMPAISMQDIQKMGLSQKQLRKLAKRFGA